VEDTRTRAEIKMAKAIEEVKKLLVPAVSIQVPMLSTKLLKTHEYSGSCIQVGYYKYLDNFCIR